MTSQRKITANRLNSQRSSGARTAAGKRKSSGNSRKHGLAALGRHQPAAADIEQLAKAICSGYQDAALLAQARRIAENELVLQAIRAHKLAVIERLRDPSAVPLAKGDNGTAMAQARLEEGKLAEKECEALIAKIFEKHKERLPPLAELNELLPTEDLIAVVQDLLLELPGLIEEDQQNEPLEPARNSRDRDEYQAVEAAAPDLDALERYERRAWSRQMRAFGDFMDIKCVLDQNRVMEKIS